jgi:hypothetical protein
VSIRIAGNGGRTVLHRLPSHRVYCLRNGRIYGECATLARVAVRACTVSFTGPSGIRYSVEVTAESVYEAAALGVSVLKKSGWVEAAAPGTELEVQVREPATSHRLTIQQIRRWCDGIAVSPDETLRKRRLKQLLA